jgi:uncharacterized protein (DUF433 family)
MTARTFQRDIAYTESVLKRKPTRRKGQDLRDFPTYSIPEAATILGIPDRTLWDWFMGERRILNAAGHVGQFPFLSFTDTVEAWVIHLLRVQHGLSMQSIRRSLDNLPKYTRARNPLVTDNLRVVEDDLLINRPKRGKRERELINLTRDGQMEMTPIVDVFAARVILDAHGRASSIFPWRFWTKDQASKPVQITPDVMSGRLVVTGTRIPVSLLAGIRRSGKSIEFIADDYGLPLKTVRQALEHFDKKAA